MWNMKMIFSLILLQSGSSPWESAVQQLQTAFTGTIARGLSLVANRGWQPRSSDQNEWSLW
jgi:type IV secretory pathway VirB2 component (pilin)